MNKRNLCRTATVLCGLLALVIHTKPDTGIGHWPANNLMGAALGLLSAIFGTQWVEYQKRQDSVLAQPGTPAWLRRLLFSSIVLLTGLGASAQTTWTARPQTGDKQLSDVAYGAGTYVAVSADDGLIRISTDGITWTNQVAGTNSTNGLSAVVYAAGKFVTVGNNGRILTSPDGLTWITQASGKGTLLGGVTYGGGQFVAVGFGGGIITSADGVTWTSQTPDLSANGNLGFNDVSYGGNRFVAVGNEGLVQTSPNGVTWTTRTSGTAADLYGVTAGGSGNFVAVGTNSTIVTSPNGVTWTPQIVAGPATFLVGVAYSTGQFVAVAATSNRLLTSADGTTWTAHPSGTSLRLYGVHYLNGQFIAVGDNGAIRSSPDGTTWKPLVIDYFMDFAGAAYGNGRYVAVGSYPTDPAVQTSYISIAVSSGDGMHYQLATTQDPAGTNNGLQDVAFGNGLFVAVGKKAGVQTSTDGRIWQLRYDDPLSTLNAVAYGGGQFVAVGKDGLVLRSTNGLTWAPGSSGPTTNYGDITYANGQFVAVGPNGAIGTSPDGITWTARTSGSTGYFTSVVYGNGTYVATGIGVGANSAVVRSADGITWTVAPSLAGNVFGITFGNGQFVIAGQIGFIGIKTSTDGLSWTDRMPDVTGVVTNLTHGNGLFVGVGLNARITTSPDDGAQPPVNQPPVAPVLLNQTAAVGTFFSYGVPAFSGSAPITYQASGLPAGLIFDAATRTISGTPTTVQAPTVTITANNAGGQSMGQFTITVSAAPANPGAFAITGVTLVSCQPLSPTQRQLVFSPQYTGLSGQPVSFQVANEMLPTMNAGPYTLGLYTDNPTITLKAVQSGTAGEASFVYNWLTACTGGVPSGNQPPVAPNIADASGTVGQVYSETIPLFTDPEGQPLTYSVIGLPPGLLVIGGGNITGPPSTAGIYMITVTATDPGGLSASATYTLTINPTGSNPNTFAITGVTLVSCQESAPGKRQLIFTPQYTGSNGQPISFEVVNETLPTTNAGPYTLGIYIDNPTITLRATQSGTPGEATFAYNWSSACAAGGARLGAEPTAFVQVRVLGNPVENGAVLVEVRGAGGQPVRMVLTDSRGQAVGSHQVAQADVVEQHTFEIGHQSAGLYLLRVNTPTQMRTLKVMKR